MPSIFELFKKHTILWAEGSTLIYKTILSQTKHPYKFLVLRFGQSCLPLELRQLLEPRRPALTLHFALLSGTLVLSNFWIHVGCKNWTHAHSPDWIIFFLFYSFTLGLEGKRKKCKNSSNTGFSALVLFKIGAKWFFFCWTTVHSRRYGRVLWLPPTTCQLHSPSILDTQKCL